MDEDRWFEWLIIGIYFVVGVGFGLWAIFEPRARVPGITFSVFFIGASLFLWWLPRWIWPQNYG